MCHYKHLTLEERQKQEIFRKTGVENLDVLLSENAKYEIIANK